LWKKVGADKLNKDAQKFINTTIKLQVENELLKHENKGLREAIILKDKKKKRGMQAQALLDDEGLQIYCISPAKVRLMKESRDTLEAEAAAEAARKTAAKAEREVKKIQKQQEIEARKQAREKKKKEREEHQQQKAAKRQLKNKNKSKESDREKGHSELEIGGIKDMSDLPVTRSGRRVRFPQGLKGYEIDIE
jgi:hypothetical protein